MKNESFEALKDDEVICRIKSDNASKYFEILYKRYHDKVLDRCYSFVKKRGIAEELTVEIFSKTYEKLDTFKQISTFSSWLYAITYNHCIDYLRETSTLHVLNWNSDDGFPEIIDENEEELEYINYDNLILILDLIHPEEKALLLMKYRDNLSLKQISTVLHLNENAIKMRLKRARTRVIELYNKKYLRY